MTKILTAHLRSLPRSQAVVDMLFVRQRGKSYGPAAFDRVMAGSDGGFGPFAGFGAVDPDIASARLAVLCKGARIAGGRI